MEFIKEITVELSGEMLFEYITAVQSDVGRKIKVILLANNQPYKIPAGATAVLRGKKPDGKAILNNCTIDESGGIIAELTKQTLAVCGNVRCQVTLYSSEGGELTSVPFVVKVTAKSANDTEVKSTNEFNAIAEAEALATSAREIASEALENVSSVEEEIEGVTNAANEAAAAAIEAASDANAAKEAATAATIRANDAAEAATDVAQRISSLHANVIKGKVCGTAVRIDDVNPIEHQTEAKVKRTNLFFIKALTSVPDSNTRVVEGNGITITAEVGNSKLIVNGHPTKNTSINNLFEITLKPGNYTISLTGSYERDYLYMQNKTTGETYTNVTNNEPRIINIVKECVISGGFVARTETAAAYDNTEIKIQIEEGSVATDWKPYVADLQSVNILRYGKNLIPYPYLMGTQTINGVTFTVNDDGTVVADGTATKATYFALWYAESKKMGVYKGKRYTLSGCPAGGGSSTYQIACQTNDNSVINLWDKGEGATAVALADGFVKILIYVGNGATVNNVEFKPQLELGDTATELEIYKGEEKYTPNEDGSLVLNSISPTMTLLPDKAGVTLEFGYNKDTNKVIESLINAIISLGGNV